MCGKKGFIRTLEAVIAIVIILGFIVYISPSKKLETEVPSNVKEAREFILHEILINQTFRDCIDEGLGLTLEDGTGKIVSGCGNCKSACDGKLEDFLDANKPVGYEYECEIYKSGTETGCGEHEFDKDVYSGVVLLNIGKSNYKEFRIFFIEK